MTARRFRGFLSLAVGGALVASMATIPSGAHSIPIKSVPGHGVVVRAVDATQTVANPDWEADLPDEVNAELFGPETLGCFNGGASLVQNPCIVSVEFDQPLTPVLDNGSPTLDNLNDAGGNLLTIYDAGNNPVSGKIEFKDTTKNTTNRNAAATMVPGPDTIVFTPGTFEGETFTPGALADGTYRGVAEIESLDGHARECDDNAETGRANCYEWTFTVAAAPATPVITSPVANDVLDHRNVVVEGTAEPGATIEVIRPGVDGENNPTETLIGTGGTDVLGDFKALAGVASGSDTFFVRATSKPATLDERTDGDYDDDPDTEDAPRPAPVVDSAAISVSTAVVNDTEAPVVELATAPDLVQTEERSVMEGQAYDNDQIAQLVVTIKDVTGATVAPGPDTYQVTYANESVTAWEIHFSAPGRYSVDLRGLDPTGNITSPEGAVVTTITITVADLLQ